MYTTIIHPIRKIYHLSLVEYCILEEIRILSHDNNEYGGWCIKSKINIAKSLDLSRATVNRALNILEERSLIYRNDNGHLRCTNEWLKILKTREFDALATSETTCLKMRHPLSQNETPTCLKMRHKNNIENNSKNKKESKKKKTTAFIPPTIDEINKYAEEKGYKINAQKFFDGYDCANWHDSNGKPVLNWKQKLIHVWFKPENKIRTQTDWQSLTLDEAKKIQAKGGRDWNILQIKRPDLMFNFL